MSNAPLGTYPVRQIIPDYDRLIADPAAVLQQRPIRIGQLKVPMFLHLLIGLGLSILFYRIWTEPEFDSRRIWIGLGVLAVVVVDLIRVMCPRHHELLLREDGVELQDGRTVVWCPWSVFADAGFAEIANRGELVQTIVLPVCPDSVTGVQLRRGSEVLARGEAIQAGQLRFCSNSQVEVPGRYAVAPRELGDMILRLGKVLGRPSACGRSRLPAATRTEKGWIVMDMTRLHFPARCCFCNAATLEVRSSQAKPSRFWPLPLLSFKKEFVPLEVPICANCNSARSRLSIPWMLLVPAVTMTAGCVACTHHQIVTGAPNEAHGIEMAFLQYFFFLPVGLALGYCLNKFFARREPFDARYRTSDRTVLLRFRSKAFTNCWLTETRQLIGDG